MQLLTRELCEQLPPIETGFRLSNPVVYARLFWPGRVGRYYFAYYVCGGDRVGGAEWVTAYEIGGFVACGFDPLCPARSLLSDLEARGVLRPDQGFSPLLLSVVREVERNAGFGGR